MAEEPRMLSPREIAGMLSAMAVFVRAELEALPDLVVNWHPGPEEWCVKEALGHIMEAERRGFNGRIREILAEDEPDVEGWDPVEVQNARNDCARDLKDLLDEFDTLRADSVELVSGLAMPDLRARRQPPASWLRACQRSAPRVDLSRSQSRATDARQRAELRVPVDGQLPGIRGGVGRFAD